jgi:hypothetical protein
MIESTYVSNNNIFKIDQPTTIVVNEFEVKGDLLNNNIIGEAKTGILNSKTDIILEEPPQEMLGKTIEEGLKAAGFTISDNPDTTDYLLTGTLEKLWVDEYATGYSLEYSKAYVRYDVIVKKTSGQVIWANTIDEYKTSKTCWDATSSNIDTLKKTLSGSVNAILCDESFIKIFTK